MKLRECLPRLSRKQKLVRNLLAAAVCLFLLEWMMDFPCLTAEGVLRRAERAYLLENTELLYDGQNRGAGGICWPTVYGRNDDTLLAVRYGRSPMGRQLLRVELYREPDNIYCFRQWNFFGEQPLRVLAFGDLKEAARAELECTVTVTTGVGDVWRTLLQETYAAVGEWAAPGAVSFTLTPHYGEEDLSEAAVTERRLFDDEVAAQNYEAVLRLYDESGALFHEKRVEVLEEKTYGW